MRAALARSNMLSCRPKNTVRRTKLWTWGRGNVGKETRGGAARCCCSRRRVYASRIVCGRGGVHMVFTSYIFSAPLTLSFMFMAAISCMQMLLVCLDASSVESVGVAGWWPGRNAILLAHADDCAQVNIIRE